MNSQLTAYITLICTSGVLNLYLCSSVFLRRHQYSNIARVFIYYMVTITIYCFASAFSLIATNLEQIKFWTIILYIGMPFSPLLGLLFIMKYLGIKTTPSRIMILFTIPVISLIMVATNDIHHLHYRVYEVDPILGAPFIHQEIGIWYVVHGIFTFSCMFVAFLLLLSRWKETAKIYRPQLTALMFGQLVPMLTAFIYLIGLTPPGVDPVPMVLWLSSLLYLWSINTSRLFTLTPIAKTTIFNSINDGVIVLDEFYRLIEFNQSCKSMFPNINTSMLGTGFEKVWLQLSGSPFPTKIERNSTFTKEIHLASDRIYQVRSSSLQHAKYEKGLLIIFTDITELKRLQVKLEQLAYYDELTQIYNRRAFFQKSEQEFAEAKKRSIPFTMILIDIDYFKKVNDTYGHHIGDQLLKHVVKACQTQLNEGELFARYGGEEFVLALKGCTAIEGEEIANKLRRYVETQPLRSDKGDIYVTLSLGVAEASEERDETLYQLLNHADKALYRAKGEGRNQVNVFNGEKGEMIKAP
ncbi:histidine kinase N-terminal 7TM domain-containing diguanylate cyclase [Metabacillus halosaccharovorans]|uniref:Diguanylate cyclase n=1 Tax=Metabacillus halosaccharovorans TaxID=930124 RepID=A0ABT3DHQ7_9BACI|nr:histidine kinase N-terminal 7TM domain-containing protein [Metabacillus halosaccharovorans]MCV9886532.1 diguanylate cyclase [Metabacillus halosaccharovorans]